MTAATNGFFRVSGLVLAGLALLVSVSGCASGRSGPPPAVEATVPFQQPEPVQQSAHAVKPPSTSMSSFPLTVPYFPPPAQLELCGESVPIQDQNVLERFDREFTMIVYNHAQIYLWLKRMERYFPWIEERLRHYNLPDDLKYVAIAESDLLPNANSPKGAGGPWQFMPATGRQYGLQQRGTYDERFDHERSTDSAFLYLQSLYKRFGNWALAIAAYNCGEGRVQEEMRSQGMRSYYHLRLPHETERYVMRIIAIKTVLSNPSRYGYNLVKGEGYPPFSVDRVRVSFDRSVPIQSIAAAVGSYYREIKRLNPTFRGEDIPPGAYVLKLPQGTESRFRQSFQYACSGSDLAPARAPATAAPAAIAPHSTDFASASGASVSPAPVQEVSISDSDTQSFDANDAPEPAYTPEPRARTAAPAVTPAQASKPAQAQQKPSTPVQPAQAQSAQARKPAPAVAGETRPEPAKSQAKAARTAAKHTVKKGETLSEIARKHDVTVDELRKANKLQGNNIAPGQTLMIP